MQMQIRDRIKDFRRVPASSLTPNPKNWRTHSSRQRKILKGILAEIGYADVLLVRELSDGSLQLIDGHLRAETTPHHQVPVLVLDLNDAESDKLLAMLDPLTALAGTDQAMLDELLAQIETENSVLNEFLQSKTDPALEEAIRSFSETKELAIREMYQILITCRDESEQRELFDRLAAEGLNCRIVNL